MLSRDKLIRLRAMPVGTSGNRLDYAMDLAEITQVQLGERTGFAQPYISRIANGFHERMPLDTARAIADVFGCTVDDIFPGRQAVAS